MQLRIWQIRTRYPVLVDRAEGTRNALGIRGYGERGMRVYDFGWVMGDRGWGTGGRSAMRLQMHATDPSLGTAA